MGGGYWGEYPDYQRGDGSGCGVLAMLIATILVIIAAYLLWR